MPAALSISWHTLLEKDPVAQFVVLPNYQVDEAMFGETLENLGRSPSAEKHVHIVLAMEPLESPNTQDTAERLMADTGNLFEDMMATWYFWKGGWQIIQYPVGLPTALEEIWCGTPPSRPQQCVHDSRRC